MGNGNAPFNIAFLETEAVLPDDKAHERRATVLVLVDEIKASGLPSRTRTLIDALGAFVDPVLVAPVYLNNRHRARKVRCRHAFYGFSAENYDAGVKAFAAELVGRYAPNWVLACGWGNSQLVVELDCLDIPTLIYIDHRSDDPTAEAQLTWTFLFADDIVFGDVGIPDSLTTGFWGLQPRNYKLLPPDPPVRSPRGFGRGLFTAKATDTPPDIGRLAAAGTRIATARASLHAQRERDAAVIAGAGLFNAELFSRTIEDRQNDPLTRYLAESRHAIPRDRAFAGRMLRRPAEGFNPLIYATDRPDFDEASGEDPFAHYLRHDRPTGRWAHPIIRPRPDTEPASSHRVAVHAHIHYTDLLPELLERLRANKTTHDLFITTTSDARRMEIETILETAGTKARQVTSGLNRGRDIWPFLELIGSGAFAGYDVVDHLHGKRSPTYDEGDRWRDFLWRHLVGDPERMLDAIAAGFAADPRLGLVMPEDPHLEGWSEDLALATQLAQRMGIALPLPTHLDYPMGTMFWARPAALAPLLDLGLGPDDMPEEPLPDDGTVLHAIERLIPLAVTKAGFTMAATHVPGSMR